MHILMYYYHTLQIYTKFINYTQASKNFFQKWQYHIKTFCSDLQIRFFCDFKNMLNVGFANKFYLCKLFEYLGRNTYAAI